MAVCFQVCSFLPFACFLYIAVQAHENHVHLPEGIGIGGKNAKSFLGVSPYWCFDGHYEQSDCESKHLQCHTEQVRAFLCTLRPIPCPDGQTCTLNETDHWRPAHFTSVCRPICDALGPNVSRCENGGTCNNINSTYFSCNCVPGYTGSDCSTDINECESDPCQHAGMCNDSINDYNCTCPNRYNGKDCELDRCKVGPADVVFLVDSSISQGSGNFNKQLNFIKDFVQSASLRFPLMPQ